MKTTLNADFEYLKSPPLQPETAPCDEAVDFLERLRPGGPWVLSAILPDGPIETITALTPSDVRAFVARYDGKRNLYFGVNPTRKALSDKAAKTDIAAIEYVFADCDPNAGETSAQAKERYQSHLETFEPVPSFVIDSGNGIQCLWSLTEPLGLGQPARGADGSLSFSTADQSKIEEVEARCAAVMAQLDAKAGTQNIDRILRLPGTSNLPNAKKKREGRVPCAAKLLKFEDVSYRLDAFPTPGDAKGSRKSKRGSGTSSLRGLDNLPEVDVAELPVSQEIKDAIGTDGSEIGSGDRSAGTARITRELLRANCTDKQIASVLWQQPISAHFRDQPNSARAIWRVIAWAHSERAKASAEGQFDAVDLDIITLNETYALVIVGGKTAILKETPHEPGGYTLLSHSAFQHWFANRHVLYNDKRISLSKYWMSHPDRRHYEGLVFTPGREVPGYYNLWRGFAVEPAAGDCSKFVAHILDNVCQGDLGAIWLADRMVCSAGTVS